ncbi:hypothetical protein K438DRAFT_1819356, partial [Mycena galopus ATCC 62051]
MPLYDESSPIDYFISRSQLADLLQAEDQTSEVVWDEVLVRRFRPCGYCAVPRLGHTRSCCAGGPEGMAAGYSKASQSSCAKTHSHLFL